MNVSTPRPRPAADAAAAGSISHGGGPVQRRMYKSDAGRLLIAGTIADPDDTALFRALLSADSDSKLPTCRVDPRDDRRSETCAAPPHHHDDAPCLAGKPGNSDRHEPGTRDVTLAGALDVAALGGVVTRVYLDSLQDRERVVRLALGQDLLPATRLSVREREGRLAVDFVSVSLPARERLRRGASALAVRVASDLSRDVTITVAAHEGDRLALEVCAAAPAGRGAP